MQRLRLQSPRYVAALSLFASLTGLVTPAPLSALEVRGRVLLGDGDPLPGATVELLPVVTEYEGSLELFETGVSEPVPRPVAVTRSGPWGHYLLRAPSPGLWRLRISAPGFVAMERRFALPEDRDVEPVSLEADVSRSFQIAASNGGRPPAWGLAASADPTRRSSEDWHPDRSLAWTRASDGALRIPRTADEELEVRVFALGYEPLHFHLPLADLEAPVRLRPEPLRRLRFAVLDPFATAEGDAELGTGNGAPVEGALILLGAGVPGTTGVRDRPFPLARTDSEGGAEVLVPRDRTAFLTVLSPDGRRSIRAFEPADDSSGDVALEADEAVVEWTLPPHVSVVGRAVDEATGEPVPGALVWFESIPGAWTRTDAQGLYQLAAPSKVTLVLRAEAAGYRGVEISGKIEDEPLRGKSRAAGEEVHEGPLFALTPVVTLTGRVLDEMGTPVPTAEVGARVSGPTPGPPPSPVDPVKTGQDGAFRMSDLTPSIPYRLTVRAEGFAPAEIEIAPLDHKTASSGRQVVEIVLSRGRAVHGIVVDEKGEPVAGARVALLWQADTKARKRFVAGRRLPESIQVFEARTGEVGSFTVNDLPAGRFELVVRAEGFAPYEIPGVEIASEETSKDLGRLELSPGLALEGWVSDRTGRPVAGAEVQLRLRLGSTRFPGPATRSDEEGRFRLEHLTADTVFDLHVRHAEFSARVVPNIAARDQELLHVELERSAVVTGRVVTTTGEPVPRAWVGAKPTDAVDSWVLYIDREGVDPTTHTDAQGRFYLPDVESGQVRLSVEAKGFQPYSRSDLDILPGTETVVEVVLEPGASVTGRVLGADGRPLSGVSVRGGGLQDNSDFAGRFRLVGVAPGTHRFVASDDEHGRTSRTVEVPPMGIDIELVFPSGYPVAGRVVGPEDEPVAGALVRLEPATEETRAESFPRSGLTDRDGEFGFPHVPPGSYRLMVRREGFAMGSTAPIVDVASGPVENLRLTLRSGGVVMGQVLGLEPGEAANLMVEARGPGLSRHGQMSGPGTYRIEGLSAGDWLVTAEVRGIGRRAQGRVRLGESGGETRLDLELGEGLALDGQVRENGEPLVDAQVHLFGPSGDRAASVRTDRSGSFRVEGLEPGTHGVEVVSLGRQIRHAETLTIERDRRIEIDLPTGSLSGRVVDSAGFPIPLARILLEPLAGPSQAGAPRWLTTQADGSFTVARLLAGRYRATVRSPGGSEANSESRTVEVTVPPGSRVEGWAVELPGTSR